MAVPLFVRARRRRLLFFMLAILSVFYLCIRQQDEKHKARLVHSVSPQDDPHFTHPASSNTPPTTSADKGAQPAQIDDNEAPSAPTQKKKGPGAEDALPAAPTALADPDEPIKLNMIHLTLEELLQRPMDPMAYDTTARPPVKGLPPALVANQRIELVVGDNSDGDKVFESDDGTLRRRRVVFVGDVHGQRAALEDLLKKVNFVAGQDHLVFVGDLVNKGPDSAGVVQLAMDLGASAVRGNHEDRVLLVYESLCALRGEAISNSDDGAAKDLMRMRKAASIEAEGSRERAKAKLQRADLLEEYEAGDGKSLLGYIGLRKKPKDEEDIIDREAYAAQLEGDQLENNLFSHGDAAERATASALTPKQARWLANLPIILHLGQIAPSPYTFKTREAAAAAAEANAQMPFNDVVVVHAGLMPDRPLHRQDPFAAMTMRSLVHPADEVRHEWARHIAEKRIRAAALGHIGPGTPINVPGKKVDAEFKRMQREAYGPDPQHPRQYAAAAEAAAAAAATAGGSAAARAAAIARAQAAAAEDASFEPADMVLLPTDAHYLQGHDRIHWAAVWNQVQHANPVPENRTTVVYGHDAITGLAVPPGVPLSSSPSSSSKKSSASFLGWFGGGSKTKADPRMRLLPADTGYTFGLDSGASYGKELTALVVEADQDGRLHYALEQVACPTLPSTGAS